jgi:diguanylate cyclase (GGDEF)-like protein/PAS domain S-box-containing protein
MSSKASSANRFGGFRPGRLQFAAVAFVVAVTIGCGAYWFRLTETEAELERDTVEQMNLRALQLADAVAGQTAILVKLVDFAIRHLRDDYSDGPKPAFQATIKSVLDAFPDGAILQIGVIDREGYLAYSNLGGWKRVYLGDREHFKVHADGAADRLFISKPVFGRVSKSWSIQFSRPVFAKGRFAGVLVVSVAPEYVASSLALRDLATDDVVSLYTLDGTYLSRSRDLAGAMGRTVPANRPFVGPNAAASGTFRVSAAFDRVKRLYAWRRLDDLPVVVNVGIGEEAVLQPVRNSIAIERMRNAAGLLVVMVLTLGIAALVLGIAARQRALTESEDRYRSFFESNAAIKLLVEPAGGRIVEANTAALAFYGYLRAEFLAMNIHDLCTRPSAGREEGRDEGGHTIAAHRLKSGELRQVEIYRGPVKVGGRALEYLIIHDVTERYRLEASQRLAQSVFEAAGEGIVVSDATNRIVAVNPAFTQITGYQPEEVLGRNPNLLASGLHDTAFYRELWQRLLQDDRWEGEIRNRRKDGQVFVEWLKIAVVRDEDGLPTRYVALFSDVTERKHREETVWKQANFDNLTGLPNRQLLDDRLDRALAQANRRGTLVAALFIDLDRFKPVNDVYGHSAGDDLLRQVALRLRNCLRDEDTIARVGGDEFVAVLPDVASDELSAHAAEKIIAAISAPYRIGADQVEISCSIGIAIYPRDAASPDSLLEKADDALYRAKKGGRATWAMA